MRPTREPPQRNAVEVVHILRGRAHLRARALANQRSACERIAHQLARDFDQHRVAVRPLTGSVVVERETGPIDSAALVSRLDELIARERDEQGTPLFASRPAAGPTPLARALIGAIREVNADVERALGGKADLASLAPLLMTASAAGGIVAKGEISHVPWFNMLWFSLQTFLSFNVAERATESTPIAERPPVDRIGAGPPAAGS